MAASRRLPATASRVTPAMAGQPIQRAKSATPVALAVDAVGNNYIVDATPCARISTATVSYCDRFRATASRGHSGDGGLATQAQLNTPSPSLWGRTATVRGGHGQQPPSGCSSTPAAACHWCRDQRRQQHQRSGGAGEVSGVYGLRLGPARLTQSSLTQPPAWSAPILRARAFVLQWHAGAHALHLRHPTPP